MTLQTLDESDYYNLHNLLTRNAPWNFVIGARGLGKTFAAKRYGIKEYIKHGHEFIYLRRTDVEQHRKETFFQRRSRVLLLIRISSQRRKRADS